MNNTTLQLPESYDCLQDAIKVAIEHYSGSPVKNQNKLNESTAKALGFSNHDQLAPLLQSESNAEPINFSVEPNKVIIDGVEISDDALDEAEYTFSCLEDLTDKLWQWISEARSDTNGWPRMSDATMMTDDLLMLLQWSDEWILSNTSTNKYISPSKDPEQFNQICKQLIEASKKPQ